MSHRQIPLRAAAILAATAGALAPVADLLAQRRKRRPANDDDDDDRDDLIRRRVRRRRAAEDDDDNDNDELVIALARARRRKAQRQEADDDAETDVAATASNRQSIVADLGIRETVQERIDTVLSGGGGGGDGDDEPNITVSEDGDSLIVLTRDIELASDSEGIEVETGGISYTSGAGGGVLDDFDS